MSSHSGSSSSPRSHRTALHERSNSEKNKLAIRIVPYTPPRLASTGSSHAEATAGGDNDDIHNPGHGPVRQAIRTPTRGGKNDYYASSPGSVLSRSSATSSPTRAKGKGVSGTKPSSDSSGVGLLSTPPTPGNSRLSYDSSRTSRLNLPARDDVVPISPSRTSRSRRDRHISVHSDKTFSVVLKPTNIHTGRSGPTSVKSPPLSNYSTVSSHERISFDAPSDDRPSSSPTSVPDHSVSPTPKSPYTPFSAASTDFPEYHISSSPNYRMVGGLRKVAKSTLDLKQKGKETGEEDEDEAETEAPASPVPSLSEAPPSPLPRPPQPAFLLAAKPSFTSEFSVQSDFSIDEKANYNILGRSSPPLLESDDSILVPPSSSHSRNYRLLGESSPALHLVSSPAQGLYDTPGSKNFIVHGDPSPSLSNDSVLRRPRPQYSDDSLVLRGKWSQDSLVVPPLKPRHKSSFEKFGYYKQRSRESLRHKYSFSSISSVISQDAVSSFLASTPNVIRLQPSTSSLRSTWVGPSNTVAVRPRMEAHSHQWSSQLSTVMSEDEGSDRDSRALSSPALSSPSAMSQDFRSNSGMGSRGSRNMLSISSSLAEADELRYSSSRSGSQSHPDSLERPGPAYSRGGREIPSVHVQHIDEDGDGLADLDHRHLSNKSSRSRLSHLLSHRSSDRDLHSSASSRPGSFTSASLPAWARLYYGSGERKWLAAPSIRSYSDDSRPGSSWGAPSGSPANHDFPPNVASHRKRPNEVSNNIDVMPMAPDAFGTVRLGIRRMTSSIWSPHLQRDRRASRYSIWQPPSTTWSHDNGLFGRRNIQILLFSIGFVFPFAWIIAAFLPLPQIPHLNMLDGGDHSTTDFGIHEDAEPEALRRPIMPIDDIQFQSARWWRNVNRFMSIIGLLIIGAIIALVVVSVKSRGNMSQMS